MYIRRTFPNFCVIVGRCSAVSEANKKSDNFLSDISKVPPVLRNRRHILDGFQQTNTQTAGGSTYSAAKLPFLPITGIPACRQ